MVASQLNNRKWGLLIQGWHYMQWMCVHASAYSGCGSMQISWTMHPTPQGPSWGILTKNGAIFWGFTIHLLVMQVALVDSCMKHTLLTWSVIFCHFATPSWHLHSPPTTPSLLFYACSQSGSMFNPRTRIKIYQNWLIWISRDGIYPIYQNLQFILILSTSPTLSQISHGSSRIAAFFKHGSNGEFVLLLFWIETIKMD